jgi:hypothetical protein
MEKRSSLFIRTKILTSFAKHQRDLSLEDRVERDSGADVAVAAAADGGDGGSGGEGRQ